MNAEAGGSPEREMYPEVARIIAWGETAIEGGFTGKLAEFVSVRAKTPSVEPKDSPDRGLFDPEAGVILDENGEKFSEPEKEILLRWITAALGESPSVSSISSTYALDDTTVEIFEKRFGNEETAWYLSRWKNEGEEPSYVLWSGEMYDMLEEQGYTALP
ncbi:MAG: hypothetical protein AAB553_03280 [Patescibacteria group bacterium]|mgnify:CR=1 FL=1